MTYKMMNKIYQIKFSDVGDQYFASLNKIMQKRVMTKLHFFANSKDPFLYAKKLVGSENKYRFKVGDYRIIFTKQENGEIIILLIIKVAHRRDVYE